MAVGAAVFLAAAPAQAQSQDCSNESSLRPAQAGTPVELLFRNASSERRRVYWIDQNGDRKFIALSEGGQLLRQPTSTGHSWVVTDEAEKCLYAVTATDQPITLEIGGVAVAQAPVAAPAPGVLQPLVQAPAQVQMAPPPVATTMTPPPAAPQAPPVAMTAPPPQAAAAPLPQVSPVEQFRLSGAYRIASGNNAAAVLNSEASGTMFVVAVKPEWTSGQWTFEAVPGTPFVRIRNQWKNTYLADVGGKVRAAALPATAAESHWTFEPVDGTSFIQFRNRETERFLVTAGDAAALVSDYRQDQEPITRWSINPVSRGSAVVARAPRNSAYDAALANCRELGGYWTGSSCRAAVNSQPLACPRGYVWSEDVGDCQWDGGSCPPWQVGPGGACMTDLTCNGGVVQLSRRGYPACYCPIGSVAWGDYPNLSCVPSVARVAPYLVPAVIGGVTVGIIGQVYGNNRVCPPGQAGTPPNCVVAATCPAPLVGTPPNCVRLVQPPVINPFPACPVGQVRAPNDACVAIACAGGTMSQGTCLCPAGTTLQGGGANLRCVASTTPNLSCPAGQTGTPPNCVTVAPTVPPVCGLGQTLQNGVCVNLNQSITCTGGTIAQGVCGCPTGTTLQGGGTNFQCVAGTAPRVCPAGTTGTPPNCVTVATTCPAGQTGTPPNCVTPPPAPDAPCAPWQTGTPGKCVDIIVKCDGGTVSQGRCTCISGLRPVDGVCTRLSCVDGVMLGEQCRCNNPGWVAQRTSFSTFTCSLPATAPSCPPDSTGTPPTCVCKPGTTGQPGSCKVAATVPPVCGPGQTLQNGICVNLNQSITCTGGTIAQGVCGCPTGTRLTGGGNNFQCVAGGGGQIGDAVSTTIDPATGVQTTRTTDQNGVVTSRQTCATGWTGSPPNCVKSAATTPNQPICNLGERLVDGKCVNLNAAITCTGGTVVQGVCGCPTGMTVQGSGNTFQCVGRQTIAPPTTNPRACRAGEYPQAANCLCPNTMTIVNGVCTAPTIAVPNTNPKACVAGQRPQAENCLCPNSMTIINGVCTAPNNPPAPPATCPAGTTGTPPNCVRPPPPPCPPGMTGTPPNCVKPPPVQCPAGTTGTPPNCVKPPPAQCPAGTTGTPPNCVKPPPAQCPAGTTGTPPNCVKPPPAQCPAGTTGTPPNCVKPPPAQCPAGTTGTPPNCVRPPPAQCPAGTTGTPPNCVRPPPAQCPAGTTGTPPNCVRPPPAQCPAGTTGTPPNCQRPPPPPPPPGPPGCAPPKKLNPQGQCV